MCSLHNLKKENLSVNKLDWDELMFEGDLYVIDDNLPYGKIIKLGEYDKKHILAFTIPKGIILEETMVSPTIESIEMLINELKLLFHDKVTYSYLLTYFWMMKGIRNKIQLTEFTKLFKLLPEIKFDFIEEIEIGDDDDLDLCKIPDISED